VLRVALLGGVPASLGGGGLELQMRRTAAALERRGHDVFHVARSAEARAFDVLHAFGSEPDIWQALQHWRRNPAPLVVSAVVVVAPGREERLLRLAARLPLRSLAQRARAEVVRRADVAIALTEHEGALLEALGARRVEVLGNGVDPQLAGEGGPAADLDVPEPYVLLLGSVSARKRQADTVRALAGAPVTAVVAGGFDGSAAERAAFESAVAQAGARWLGEVPPGRVRALLRGARALVHLSAAEGQSLAVLEALAANTPVIATPLPANVELAARHPAHLRLIDGLDELPAAVADLRAVEGPAPQIPSWDDVAGRLEALYRRLTRL
jgi:glycosyltransferase involved in cell wall biosynthesis